MAVEIDFIEQSMNLIDGSPVPQVRIPPAKLFVGNLAGEPFVQITARRVLPEAQPLMDVAPRAGNIG